MKDVREIDAELMRPSDTLWDKAKRTAVAASGGVGLAILKAALSAEAMKALGLK